jgi:ferritin
MAKNDDEMGLDELVSGIRANVQDAFTLFSEMNAHIETMNSTKNLKDIAMDAAKVENFLEGLKSYMKEMADLRKSISLSVAAAQKNKDLHTSIESFS